MGKMSWLFFALGSAVVWGFWGLLDKIVIDRVGWPILIIGSGVTYLFFVPIIIYYFGKDILQSSPSMWVLAILGGITASLGMVLFFMALSRGSASVVVPLTAIYPAVTVILSLLILKEKPGPYQIVGIILAIVAVVFLSIRK